MISLNCKICGQSNVEDKHFWVSHRIKLQDYLISHEPRKDLFDNSPIIFKSKKQYLTAFFNSRKNLSLFLQANSDNDCIKYLQNSLIEQKNANDWIYVPSEIEILSYINPSISTINKYFDFHKFCETTLKLKPRFNNPFIDSFIDLKKNRNIEILTDTREQRPVLSNTIIKKLNYGDYALNLNNLTYAVERKSLPDLLKSVTADYERFEREIIRAKEANGYLFIIVEETLKNALYFDQNTIMKRNSGWKMKITADFVFSNIRKLLKEYNHIQFLFVNGRTEFEHYLKLILFNAEILSQTDLQANYNQKMI